MLREKLDREKGKVIIFCASILSLPFANRRDRVEVGGKYLKDDLALPPLKVANHRESLTKDGPINKLCQNI